MIRPGHKERSYQITLAAGQTKELEVQAGALLPKPDKSAQQDPGRTQRTVGLAAGGVGLVGVAAAVVTGLLLPSTRANINENCPDKLCNEDGFSAVKRGKTLLALNTVGWIVGGVGLASGTTLWLTSKKKPEADRAARSAPPVGLEVYSDGALINYFGTF